MVCSMPALQSQRRSFDLFCLIRQTLESAALFQEASEDRHMAWGCHSGSNPLAWTASCVFVSFADEFKRLCHLQIANCCRDNAGAEASGGCGFQVTGHQ